MRKGLSTLKVNQAYLENGTYDQILKHLEREIELNGLEADEHLVKTQMTVTKKDQNNEKPNEIQNHKAKKQTPKTVPDKTLKNDQCRYCKDASHMMTDYPNQQNSENSKKTRRHPNAPTVELRIITKKIAILVPIWIIDHRNGT